MSATIKTQVDMLIRNFLPKGVVSLPTRFLARAGATRACEVGMTAGHCRSGQRRMVKRILGPDDIEERFTVCDVLGG